MTNRNLQAAAIQWMAANPGTMQLLAQFALDAKRAGVRQMGIGFLAERLRWYGVVEKRDADGYKINNNHRAWVARELMRRYQSLEGFFTTRQAGNEWKLGPAEPTPGYPTRNPVPKENT